MKLTVRINSQDQTVTIRALIPKSKKLGLPKRQRTWKLLTVAPNFSAEEMKKSYEAEAQRWEAKELAKIRQQQADKAIAEMFGTPVKKVEVLLV